MHLAVTFQESLTNLVMSERGAVLTAILQYESNPTHPSLNVHQIDRISDKNFRSFRASSDIRIIVHTLAGKSLICYVGHHDDAYEWARKRTIGVHPNTGAIQIVEIDEVTQPVTVVTPPTPQAKPLFAHVSDAALLNYGIPVEALPHVRAVYSEDQLLVLCETLPKEAADALLDLFEGRIPQSIIQPESDPFRHPDTLRRFFHVKNRAELELAFAEQWESWMVFLHPAQRILAQRTFNGPARVAGSAGTGKTVVAIHRAAFLARQNPSERILLTTISNPLARALEQKLNILLANEPQLREQIEVNAIDAVARNLSRRSMKRADRVLDPQVLRKLIYSVSPRELSFPVDFLQAEWLNVIDAWQIADWETYRTFRRLGRNRRLNEAQRQRIWQVMERISREIDHLGMVTLAGLYARLSRNYVQQSGPYAAIVVDECQDLAPYHLKFLAAMTRKLPNGLFFSGDSGQQIFQVPFSWASVGVSITGRASLLKVNYRTSQQIRIMADKLVNPYTQDVDGNDESRNGTHSVFSGPTPEIIQAQSVINEIQQVSKWITQRINNGMPAHEMCIIVRGNAQVDRARAAAQEANIEYAILDEDLRIKPQHISIITMHLAKGLEFRSVVIMACDQGVLPDDTRFESDDPNELNAINDSERQLLYVAMTRARDELLLSSAGIPSEFLVSLSGR